LAAVGRQTEAESHFREALQYQPDVPTLHFFYARWLEQAERTEEALLHLEKAVELSPADLSARHLLMKILARKGKWTLLDDLARGTLAIEQGDSIALDYARIAQEHSRTKSTAASESAEAYLAQSAAYFQNGHYQEALAASDLALKLRPDYAEAFN